MKIAYLRLKLMMAAAIGTLSSKDYEGTNQASTNIKDQVRGHGMTNKDCLLDPNSSGSDQENQSPTSVLSAGGSNMFALGDLCSPNTRSGSSPVSSANGVKPSGSSNFEPGVSPD
ncbi:hypothetical protein Tco_1559546 [Tanacetum coccineum]